MFLVEAQVEKQTHEEFCLSETHEIAEGIERNLPARAMDVKIIVRGEHE
jgi:hypothetical protein